MKHMKRNVLALALIALLAISPVLSSAAMAESYTGTADVLTPIITFGDALSMATDAYPGMMLVALSLENENGIPVYQAEFVDLTKETVTEISIDSMTGQILSPQADEGTLEGNDEAEQEDGDNQGNHEYVDENDQDENEDENETEQDGNLESDFALLKTVTISAQQCLDLILTRNPGVAVNAIELENENGVPVFEISFADTSGQQQYMMINAASGAYITNDAEVGEH